MKKLFIMFALIASLSGWAFAQYSDVIDTHDWLRSLPNSTDADPLAIERAQLFSLKEKGKGNVKSIVTELDFALKHDGMVDSKWHSLYWIEIKRTVTFKNDQFDHNDPIIDLGLSELQINEQVWKLTEKDMHVSQKIHGKTAVQVVRIIIDRDMFDDLGNRQAYSYHLKATNFADRKVSLNARESAKFSNAISRIEGNRQLREENQKP